MGITEACECGVTLKLNFPTGGGAGIEEILEVFREKHEGHERVEPWQATRVRENKG